MSPITQPSFDEKGLFLAPQDTQESYNERCLAYYSDREGNEQARERVKQLYNFDPCWVEILYSNKDLRLWEGGCTWLDSPPQIQLRTHFKTHDTLFGIYPKEEILVHEYVHAARAHLHSVRFEECFAYLPSLSRKSGSLRAFLGPLFQTPQETFFFISTIALFILSLFSDFWPWIAGCITLLLLFFFTRLGATWWRFWQCKKNLTPITHHPLALMVRLTDDEIELFSTLSSDKINHWITEQKQTNYRLQILSLYILD